MMEKSSEVVLSKEEKNIIQGKNKLTKEAGASSALNIPSRFEGWYTHEELKRIANEQN